MGSMGAGDPEVARAFLDAVERAAATGDREPVYPLLAPDVVWVTPKRELAGIDAVREQLTWGAAPEHLDLEFTTGDMTDLGDGRIATDVREVYRMKGTGDFAYARTLRIELTIRDGRIARYERRDVG
jgi:ketosteroid isomerase-like protein